MNESALVPNEPRKLTDTELEAVSGGVQSLNGFFHEDKHENINATQKEVEKGGQISKTI